MQSLQLVAARANDRKYFGSPLPIALAPCRSIVGSHDTIAELQANLRRNIQAVVSSSTRKPLWL